MNIKTIVLADDDGFMRQLLTVTLRDFDIHTASNGADAHALAREVHPDLILLDFEMPGQDGITTCRAIRSDPTLADVPIVLLTGNHAPETREAGLAAGANAFLNKPFRPLALMELIDELSGYGATVAAKRANRP